MTARVLTIMGSGETAPTMVEPHKALFARLGASVDAVLLDTPFGFQENADELVARATEYFEKRVGRPIAPAGLRTTHGSDAAALEQAYRRVRNAGLVFAGPGSPTYTLRQWRDTPVPGLLRDKLATGGVVTFASAAALTLGLATIPVYEIYKAGEPPRWEAGIDLLSAHGLPVAVIPHYDNTEGGTHDTRFCYLGERRLAQLEGELPDGAFVLGVDEHTGLVLDLVADTAKVVGNGSVTVRRNGASQVWPTGSEMPIDDLRHGRADGSSRPAASKASAADAAAAAPGASGVGDESARCRSAFDASLAAGDGDGALAAALALEQALDDWSGDPTQSDERDRARADLRGMLAALVDTARAGLGDPTSRWVPLIDAALDSRAAARAAKDWAASDRWRDTLAGVGIAVADTPDGQTWSDASP